jgi:hypothetical protein
MSWALNQLVQVFAVLYNARASLKILKTISTDDIPRSKHSHNKTTHNSNNNDNSNNDDDNNDNDNDNDNKNTKASISEVEDDAIGTLMFWTIFAFFKIW